MTTEYKKRKNFNERMNKASEETREYYNTLQEKLLNYDNVKSRVSLRCDSYRKGRKLIAKISLGGKTMKLYLAIDAKDAFFEDGKYHQRDLSNTKAYEEVPSMFPIRSQLAVRKAMQVIDEMMSK